MVAAYASQATTEMPFWRIPVFLNANIGAHKVEHDTPDIAWILL